jgi:hypothetical protein
MNGGGAQ